MKHSKMMMQLVAGLLFCLSATTIYAVCVTPTQLTNGVHDLKTNPYYNTVHPATDNADFVASLFQGRAPFAGFVRNVAPPIPADSALNQWSMLNTDTTNWQHKDSDFSSIAVAADKAKAISDQMKMIQTWANYGELVIAITTTGNGAEARSAIVVPESSGNTIAKGTAGAWQDINIPRIAAIGKIPANSTAGAAGGDYREENKPMTDMFADPTKVSFFRYKN